MGSGSSVAGGALVGVTVPSDSSAVVAPSDPATSSIVVAITLVVLLAHLDLLSARPDVERRVLLAVTLAIVPLLVTFGCIVLYESLQIVGVLEV